MKSNRVGEYFGSVNIVHPPITDGSSSAKKRQRQIMCLLEVRNSILPEELLCYILTQRRLYIFYVKSYMFTTCFALRPPSGIPITKVGLLT